MKLIKTNFFILLFFLYSSLIGLYAQKHQAVTGKVINSLNQPIEGAVVSISGHVPIITSKDGLFGFELKSDNERINVRAEGFFPVSRFVEKGVTNMIVMISDNQFNYNETLLMPFVDELSEIKSTSSTNISKKDFSNGSVTIDQVLVGRVSGLSVTPMGGMPGEGSYLNLRGNKSLVGDNSPLIVINGVPYLPNKNESNLINGYVRNVFQTYNIDNIQNITVLKGVAASLYGSLGSNGVILIETNKASSTDLETKISFAGQYGVNWNNKRLPLLSGKEYNSYLSDIGMTYYDNMDNFLRDFPFLSDANSKYNYLYNNNTDWQDLIYRRGFLTDNNFRVRGGDAIAKYDLSLGYSNSQGVLNNTYSQRYNTLLNTSVLISKQVEMNADFGLSFLNGVLKDQGMVNQTNPVLAAYKQAPLLSPFNKDDQGNTLASYSSYYYGNNDNQDFAVSNPLAIIDDLDARNKQYDINVKTSLNYRPLSNLTFTGSLGLYYNFNNEHLFVPGLTNKTIVPLLDQFGEAYNTVKEGIAETFNMYCNINGNYKKDFDSYHSISVAAGFQALTTKSEYDVGTGRNTANDFYQTLGNTQSIGRNFSGYINKWNWMNMYGHVNYSFKDLLIASLNMSVDGSSSSGIYGDIFSVYPSASLTWQGKSWLPLANSTIINKLNVRAEYGKSGNSRFSSNFGKYYYRSMPYQNISGIIRGNISNTKLKPETNSLFNIGLETSLFYNRLDLNIEYYYNRSDDVIFALPLSSVYGSNKYYDNCGVVDNNGLEVAMHISPIRTKDFEWIIGGNIAFNKNKVKSLNGYDQLISEYGDVQLITKVGEPMYQYYGMKSNGVFSTQSDADAANLKNKIGKKFNAGDVHFEDLNKDNHIDDKDRTIIGNANPDFFGGFFTKIQYKSFALSSEFIYSNGNQAYNTVRRDLESLSHFGNQSVAVVNRWNLEGQVTDVPRAQWKDPVGNSIFSSRWIEDASYMRMKNVAVSYSFDRKVLNFFRSGTVYITGENLLTFSNYLGLDPVFSYSHSNSIQGFDFAKIMQPKTIKLGVNLNS